MDGDVSKPHYHHRVPTANLVHLRSSHGAITNSRAELIPEAELLKARKASLPPAEQPLKRPAPAPAPAVKKEPAAAVATEKSSETPPADQKAKANGHDKAEEEKPKSGKSSASKGSANIASMFAKASSEKVGYD